MNLIDLALAQTNLFAAWQRVSANGGAAGTDGVCTKKFGADLALQLESLRIQVLSDGYVPQPLLEVRLERPGKTPRFLAIPAVRDRVLQTAVAMTLNPVLDPGFCDASFGYRPGRSVTQAVKRVIEGREFGLHWVLDADIKSFFDTIPHESLIERLGQLIADPTLLPLIHLWLTTPVMSSAGLVRRGLGLAQGSPLSPLLANLYLDSFDKGILQNPANWLVRYADDFVILTTDESHANQALAEGADWLDRAGLSLNSAKTRVTNFADGFDFLGAHFQGLNVYAIDPGAAQWVLPTGLQPANRPGHHATAVRQSHEGRERWSSTSHSASPGATPATQTSERKHADLEFDADAPPFFERFT